MKNEPKHWPSVDASFYGGGGAGGIKPVAVRFILMNRSKKYLALISLCLPEFSSVNFPSKSKVFCRIAFVDQSMLYHFWILDKCQVRLMAKLLP